MARKEPKKSKKTVKSSKGKKGATARADADTDDDNDDEADEGSDHDSDSDEAEINTVDDVAPLPQLKERLNRVLEGLKKDLAVLRGGRVDPGMFDHLTVHSYGQEGPLSTVAQVSVKGPQLLVLTCFDPSSAPEVLTAVRDSGMNLNPQMDGGTIRVPIPKASQETRENMGKVAAKAAEKAKVHMRGIRHKVLEKLKLHKDTFSADEVHRRHKEVDNIVSKMEAACAAAVEAKKKEIMSS